MNSTCLSSFTRLVVLAACLSLHAAAQAQATRTWISGVGDDANPCSRTAPCKNFGGGAGALPKTAIGGEIDIIDPLTSAAFTIAKSITIDGGGALGAVTGDGTTAITVAAGSNDVVTIRNISINGTGTGIYGIRITGAGVVRVENCDISGGTASGIDFEPAGTNSRLYVINSKIHDFTGAGIFVNPATGGTAAVVNSVIEHCGTGLNVAGGTATLMESTIAGNTGAGLLPSGAGAILTYHNNEIFGNSPDGTPTGSLPLR